MSNDAIELKMFMSCKACGNDELGVGVSTDNELVMVCHKCNAVVAAFSNWPDESVINCKGDCCGGCDTDKPSKEEMN